MTITWQGKQVDLLSVLYELILDSELNDDIRQILLHAKNELERGKVDLHVIKQLKNHLRIFALKGELNQQVTTFLTEISRKTSRKYAFFSAFFIR